MHLHPLHLQPSILSEAILGIRDKNRQLHRTDFKRHLKTMGGIMAYEISKSLAYTSQTVETPLGTYTGSSLCLKPVLACILRAALPFYEGIAEIFSDSDSVFIAAYRSYTSETEFEITQKNVENAKNKIITNVAATIDNNTPLNSKDVFFVGAAAYTVGVKKQIVQKINIIPNVTNTLLLEKKAGTMLFNFSF